MGKQEVKRWVGRNTNTGNYLFMYSETKPVPFTNGSLGCKCYMLFSAKDYHFLFPGKSLRKGQCKEMSELTANIEYLQ